MTQEDNPHRPLLEQTASSPLARMMFCPENEFAALVEDSSKTDPSTAGTSGLDSETIREMARACKNASKAELETAVCRATAMIERHNIELTESVEALLAAVSILSQGDFKDRQPAGIVGISNLVLLLAKTQGATDEALVLASKVFERSSEAILITDDKNIIVDANPAWCSINGYSRDEAVGMTPAIIASGMQPPEFYSSMWSLIRQTGSWKGDILNRGKNGEIIAGTLSINSVSDRDGNVKNYLSVFSDLTGLGNVQKRLDLLANYDILTGLPNRNLFADRCSHAIDAAERDGSCVAVALIGLDNVKLVNGTHGHAGGDALLKAAAERILSVSRKNDTVARISGDEFAILIESAGGTGEITAAMARIVESIGSDFSINGHCVPVSACSGVAVHPDDGSDSDTLLRNAESAMREAKRGSIGDFAFFQPKMTADSSARLETINALRHAVDFAPEEFRLVYQPKVSLCGKRRVLGAEALLRWKSSKLGREVMPMDFIRIAESAGLMRKIGSIVIDSAAASVAQWNSKGFFVKTAVNLSAEQLSDPGLADSFVEICQRHGIHPESFEMEITETAVISDEQTAKASLDTIRSFGSTIAADDFGTGFASLSYLRKFPIDTIKIDRSFVCEMSSDQGAADIVRSIVAMANALGMQTVAEGVETQEQAVMLSAMGCECSQGYHFSRLLERDAFESFVSEFGNR